LGASAGRSAASGSRSRVLVVEDEPELVLALTRRLTAAGYDVLSTPDGEQAALMALEHQPHLVLLDISLSNWDGHLVARRLRENPQTVRIPIIFLTSKIGEINRAEHSNPVAVLIKPYRADQLLALVKQCVEVSERFRRLRRLR
jgi:DNA-binding response OmpR family regulator